MVRVGVVLSGCGYLDGAEIHESVLAGYFLEKEGAELAWCAPDVDQMHVVNHLTGAEAKGERRNVLVESARIARGDIVAVDKLKVSAIDALVLPGGYGAAKNLCDFATKGAQCAVHPAVEGLVRAVHAAGKPIGAICIAPALIARILGPLGPQLTIGEDAHTAKALESLGARHQTKAVHEIVVDRKLKLVTTPAYMLGPRIADVARGIEELCREVVALARTPAGVS
ncbi:MAG TPA: isoprenoid biosynthesis glyoxalase ElbB [Planctomycetota bacterium]|nr:isoprenoid biosynthesis glyoxalase ElbB [Planctomycetota bacterium]